MNIYLRVKQLEKFLPIIAFGLAKERKDDNIKAGHNLFGWHIDFTINSALKIYEVCWSVNKKSFSGLIFHNL